MRHVYRVDDDNRTEIVYRDIKQGDRIQFVDDNGYVDDIKNNIVRIAKEFIVIESEDCCAWNFEVRMQ